MHTANYTETRETSLKRRNKLDLLEPEQESRSGNHTSDGSNLVRASASLATDAFSMDSFVRELECERITGLSRSTRWRLERAGRFPKRRRLSSGAIGWLRSELSQWVATRQAA